MLLWSPVTGAPTVDRKTPIVAQWARAGPDTALLAEQTKLQ